MRTRAKMAVFEMVRIMTAEVISLRNFDGVKMGSMTRRTKRYPAREFG
jgi:hypothetical protein